MITKTKDLKMGDLVVIYDLSGNSPNPYNFPVPFDVVCEIAGFVDSTPWPNIIAIKKILAPSWMDMLCGWLFGSMNANIKKDSSVDVIAKNELILYTHYAWKSKRYFDLLTEHNPIAPQIIDPAKADWRNWK